MGVKPESMIKLDSMIMDGFKQLGIIGDIDALEEHQLVHGDPHAAKPQGIIYARTELQEGDT